MKSARSMAGGDFGVMTGGRVRGDLRGAAGGTGPFSSGRAAVRARGDLPGRAHGAPSLPLGPVVTRVALIQPRGGQGEGSVDKSKLREVRSRFYIDAEL